MAKPSIPYGRVLQHPCPDCGARMILRRSRYGPFYGCEGYPRCSGSHGAHEATGEPLGIPASKETKKARIEAHGAFDALWKGDGAPMRRGQAYRWLAEQMGLEEVHIGALDMEQCAEVVELAEGYDS